MATRFTRVDLGDDGRDFQPLALEPGVPLLDKSGANSKTLSRWLGRLTAEPVWEDESVDFFARDDHNGRLEEVFCEPVTGDDIEKLLQDDVATLRERIEKAKPDTATERALKKIIRQHFREVFENPDRRNTDNYVFRYKDANGNWRLIWCWGYQRIDQKPATAVVCGEEKCNLLYVRRPGENPKCPACEALLTTRRTKKRKARRRLALVLILLPLLLAALWWYPSRLEATPEQYLGAVGSRVEPKVEKHWLFWTSDVTDRAQAEVSDPAVARFDAAEKSFRLIGPGRANVRFRLGNLSTEMVIIAEPSGNVAAGKSANTTKPPNKTTDPDETDQHGAPFAVYILSDQGDSVEFSVDAEFDDFRVEAHYEDGFVRMATKKAVLRPSDSVLAPRDGRLIGLRPGRALVHAEFRGVRTKEPLQCTVTEDIRITDLKINPSPVIIGTGESYLVTVTGYRDGKSMGILTGVAGMTFASAGPSIAAVNGPCVTGVKEGQTTITAELGGVRSEPADVDVRAGPIRDRLVVVPPKDRIYVGQGVKIGADVSVYRGKMDVSEMCNVVSGDSGGVRYVPETHSLVGISPGWTKVAFLCGDGMASMSIRVLPGVIDGEVIIEPSDFTLSPNQSMPLRVFVQTLAGEKIDRTSSAVLKLANPEAARYIELKGNRVCALAPTPGPVEVEVFVPGSTAKTARVTVDKNGFFRLICRPSSIGIFVGDRRRLTVLGQSASGIHEIFPQPGLELTLGGVDPGAIRIGSDNQIEGVRQGRATIGVRWRDLSEVVDVKVLPGKGPFVELQIEPAGATIRPRQPMAYLVTAACGGVRTVLTEQDGVQLTVAHPEVASAAGGGKLAVMGIGPGRTTVTASFGKLSATASLEVRGTPPPPPVDLRIEPPNIVMKVGQVLPIVVTIDGPNGRESVPATVYSLNPGVVTLEEPFQGHIVARGPGQTHLQAEYRGATALARVTVEGVIPLEVELQPEDLTRDSFRVKVRVRSPASAGPLEYRVHQRAAQPTGQWVASQPDGEYRRAVFTSGLLPRRPQGSFYNVVVEIRDETENIHSYPITFRLTVGIDYGVR